MKTEYIATEIRESIGIITINAPHTLNAINGKILEELSRELTEFENLSQIKVVVIKGIEQSFAAGLDIKKLAENLNSAKTIMQDMQKNFQTLQNAKKPLIAVVSGFALGVGCEIAMCCDIVVATETARFGFPELSIGLLPCFGGCSTLTSRVGKAKAMDMILTGRALSAEEAEKAGLVSRVVTPESLTEEYLKIAQRIANLPQYTVLAAKQLITTQAQTQNALAENLLGLSSVESSDFKETLLDFAQKNTVNM